MLELKNVTKFLNHQPVVEDISFTVTAGEVLGLLAPVAAGKTTIVRLLLTVLRPDRGEIMYNSKRIKNLAGGIFGYIPQLRGISPRARVIKYLVYSGVLNQLSKTQAYNEAIDCLHKYELVQLAEVRLGELSTEIQEKILIVSTILHRPDILVVDEPFAGFAESNEDLIENLLSEFRQNNKLVILASRDLDRAENICNRVCFLHKGKLILNLTVPEIRTQVKDNVFYLETEGDISFIKQVKEIQIKTENKNLYKISLREKSFDVHKLISLLNKNIDIIKFEQFRPGLMYIYTQLVKSLQRSVK
jgi:ABC-2 type transport system ATP-binding protein